MTPMSILFWTAGLALGLFVLYRTAYWFNEGRKLQVSGYMTPPSTKLARWTFKLIANVGTRLLVGPVQVFGKENARFQRRALVLPNHIITWDFGVVGKAIPFSYRQLSKAAEIKNPIIATAAAGSAPSACRWKAANPRMAVVRRWSIPAPKSSPTPRAAVCCSFRRAC